MKKNLATKVEFTELYEAKGAFGYEGVSPGGSMFPKHLIYSYDLKTKTVIFPLGWIMNEAGGANENNWKRDMWEFSFNPFWNTVFRHNFVKKIDCIEVDYDLNWFKPLENLGLMTLSIPLKNKNRADKLIEKYVANKTIVAQRSRELGKVSLYRIGRNKTTKRTVQKYIYELALQKSKWKNFAKKLHEQNLIHKTDPFGVLLSNYVFPKQLAYFEKTN